MMLIAHRGNLVGPDLSRENHPDYIKQALDLGYHVEIDVWSVCDTFALGHDGPQYEIDLNFLKDRESVLWCHAKNIQALSELIKYKDINCFWHQDDDVTLTSKGFLWTYPGKELTNNSICVNPSLNQDLSLCAGVCDDEIIKFKELC